MLRILDRATRGLMVLLGVGLLLMIGLSFWNVVSRYVFSRALLWADEAAVFSMIVLAFLGAVVCARRGTDIRMDIIVSLLPQRLQRVIGILQQAVIAVLCFWLAWQALAYIGRAYDIGMRSDAARVPMWLIHAVIPVSLALMGTVAVLRGVRMLLTGASLVSGPIEDPAR